VGLHENNCCVSVKQQSLTHSLTSNAIRSHMSTTNAYYQCGDCFA
jgi:hypothetical protein